MVEVVVGIPIGFQMVVLVVGVVVVEPPLLRVAAVHRSVILAYRVVNVSTSVARLEV